MYKVEIDFERSQIIIREGKGDKDRVTVLPESVKMDLEKFLYPASKCRAITFISLAGFL